MPKYGAAEATHTSNVMKRAALIIFKPAKLKVKTNSTKQHPLLVLVAKRNYKEVCMTYLYERDASVTHLQRVNTEKRGRELLPQLHFPI